jgi:integrase
VAGISRRKNSDGTITHQVRWRAGGTRAGKACYESFTSAAKAERFRLMVEEAGHHWPEGWVPGEGLVVHTEPVRRERPTVLAVLERYIDQLTSVGPDTRSRYRRQAKVLDSMLNRPTAWDVTDEDVRKWVLAFGRPPYSKAPKTVSNYHGLLAAGMDWALGKGLVQANPCVGTKLPRRDTWIDGEDESKALTPEEYVLLWRGMHPDSRDFIDVAVGSGLRFGELTALWVKDIDTVNQTVQVRRAWKREGDCGERPDSVRMLPKHETNRGYYLGPPKTRRSRRTVHVSASVMEILVRRTEGRAPDDFVFTTAARSSSSTNVRWMGGRAINYVDFFESRWRPAVDSAVAMGLTRRPRFHNLRATFAVWLLTGGVDVVGVQELLGHDSLEVTRIYLNSTQRSMALARAAIDNALQARRLGDVDGDGQSLTGSEG